VDGVGVTLIVREAFSEGDSVLTFDSRKDGGSLEVEPGRMEVRLRLPYCGLRPGTYTAKINLNRKSIDMLDAVEAFRFTVAEGRASLGQSAFYQPRAWDVVGLD
jgi:lipopolysaccharide transport system ATP-binding protein